MGGSFRGDVRWADWVGPADASWIGSGEPGGASWIGSGELAAASWASGLLVMPPAPESSARPWFYAWQSSALYEAELGEDAKRCSVARSKGARMYWVEPEDWPLEAWTGDWEKSLPGAANLNLAGRDWVLLLPWDDEPADGV